MLKKIIAVTIICSIFLLAGCSAGENWEVNLTKTVQFKQGEESTIEIIVTEENKPVTDISAKAHLEMPAMDHGSVNLRLKEGKDGVYTGRAKLTMSGTYTATFTLKKEGYTIEKILEIEVQKADGVASS
ncbi:FixH family protein [Neobacillus sp. LXY-4]|uniref:FixH family protein n=1 Tax=Neobacillus sp. LXY-4 TaxID=3379826 RepID=UPI003EDFFAD3